MRDCVSDAEEKHVAGTYACLKYAEVPAFDIQIALPTWPVPDVSKDVFHIFICSFTPSLKRSVSANGGPISG